jgi:hypothetical protein
VVTWRLILSRSYSRGLDGTEFVPGTIGLNNLRATDYMNVVIQVGIQFANRNPLCFDMLLVAKALALVSPLRDFFLTDERHEAYVEAPTFTTKNLSSLHNRNNPSNFTTTNLSYSSPCVQLRYAPCTPVRAAAQAHVEPPQLQGAGVTKFKLQTASP